MKRLSLLFVLVLYAFAVNAQLYISGIGVRAGKFNTGITSKFFFYSDNATGVQFDGYYTNIASGGYTLKAFLVRQAPFKIPIVQLPLDFIFGAGLQAGYFPFDEQGYYKRSGDDADYYTKSVLSGGVNATIQIEYQVKKIAPVTIGIDAVPYFDFINPGPEYIDFGVSVRYVFR